MSGERRAEDLTPLQNAVFLLKQTQAKLAASERHNPSLSPWWASPVDFRVVRMIPRRSGDYYATGPTGWRKSPRRWNADEYYDPDPLAPNKMNTKWGGFIEQRRRV